MSRCRLDLKVKQCRQFSCVQATSSMLLRPEKPLEQRRNLSLDDWRNLTFADLQLPWIRDAMVYLQDSKMTAEFVDKLAMIHDVTSLPWWVVIVSTSVGLNLLLRFPAQVFASKIVVRRRLCYQDLDENKIPALQAKISSMQSQGKLSPEDAKILFKKEAKVLIVNSKIEYNCASSKFYLPQYIQLPVWISNTIALRKLILDPQYQLQFMVQGPLLMDNLAVPCQTMALPIFLGAIYFTNMNIGRLLRSSQLNSKVLPPSTAAKYINRFMIVFFNVIILLMVYLTTIVESGVALYWTTSGIVTLMTNLFLMSPRAKRLVGIKVFNDDPKNPYQLIYKNAMKIFKKS